jgi:hypothetical protein
MCCFFFRFPSIGPPAAKIYGALLMGSLESLFAFNLVE